MWGKWWGHGRDLEVHNMHTYLWSWVSLIPREARRPTCSIWPPRALKSLCPWKPPSSMRAIWCCSSLGAWREATHVQTGRFSYTLRPHLLFRAIPCLPSHPSSPSPQVVLLPHECLVDLVALVSRGGLAHPAGEGRAVSNQPSRGARTS